MTKFSNTCKMLLLTVLLGAATGAIVWAFVKAVSTLYRLIWSTLPEMTGAWFLPLLLCPLGGLAVGFLHKKYGEYPEELPRVLAQIKTQKHYDYSHMLVLILCAMIPLSIGASVGPEAGLTGIIAGLCYWIGDNVKYAREYAAEYTRIGAAASLGGLFHVPLFGIFAVEETPADQDDREGISFPKSSRLLLYGLSTGAAFLVMSLLGNLFGRTGGGIPDLPASAVGPFDLALMLLYIPAGLALYAAFAGAEFTTGKAAPHVPPVLREVLAGLCMAAAGLAAPMILSSGEEEMGSLCDTFTEYGPWFLIGMSLLKVLMTAFCIRFGLKGGHFFPLIYACTLLGYGLALLIFPNPAEHAVFAAAIINGTTLGAQMKKPLAVVMLLLLCFPLKYALYIFIAAAIGTRIAAAVKKHL